MAGDAAGGTTKTLRRMYPSEEQAQAAAVAAVTQAKRRQREIHLQLAVGKPELIAGQPLRLTGWRREIDEVPRVVEEATHTLDGDGGLTTSLTAHG